MGIQSIKIKNFKSLKNVYFDFSNKYDAFCILGENGAGKSNLLDAIKYFYEKLSSKDQFGENILDKVNTYSQKMQIEIIYDLSQLQKTNTNLYLDEINQLIDVYKKDSKIAIKLIQYRNGQIQWFPDDYDLRKSLNKLFPLYMIDTRFISLQEWSQLWDVMSELGISNIKINDSKRNEMLNKCFEAIYGEKYSKSLKRIQEILENEKIYINDKNYMARFKNALQVRLRGTEFIYDENNLQYNSDGINSLKYIKLFLQLISSLADTGWKNPLIILDEPEIGLHLSYIDELVDCINTIKSKRVTIAFTTHSTNLVAKLIKNDISVSIDRIFHRNNYSFIERMRDIVNDTDKNIISTRETECYFAKGIAFVEGKTEFQVFQHRKLTELFPQLKKIHFYQSSDGASMKIIDPSNAKYTVPYIIISDMDKILKYSKNHFRLKNDESINPLTMKKINKTEKYMYFQYDGKKDRTYGTRKKILKVLRNKKFIINSNKYWVNDVDFNYLICSVKQYCYEYNVYPVQTTIEGSLVNEKNAELFVQWYLKKYPDKEAEFQQELSNPDFEDLYCKTLFLRLIVNGKTDFLMTKKEAYNQGLLPNNIVNMINTFSIGSKVSGWIKEYFDYIFSIIIDPYKDLSIKKIQFAKYFPELNSILQILCDMVE